MKIFATVLILLCSMSMKEEAGCLQLDIILIADLSGSVRGFEPFVSNALNAFTDKFDLDEEGIEIGAIVFNTNSYLLSRITSNKKELDTKLKSMAFITAIGDTNMLLALQMAIDEFMAHGRRGFSKIIVIVSDGVPSDSEKTAEQIKGIGITVCGVFIDNTPTEKNKDDEYSGYGNTHTVNNDSTFMKTISSPGLYVKSNYQGLVDELGKLDVCL